MRSLASARTLGLVREQAAIGARYARVPSAWAPHLEASRRAILSAASRCSRRRIAWVIGAGDCLDVPVSELAQRFERVFLTDVVLSAAARRWARTSRGQVEARCWDATGVLDRVAEGRTSLTSASAQELFRHGRPAWPKGVEPDFVISANCLSQLGLVPAEALAASRSDPDLPHRCGRAAAEVHLEWLGGCAGTVTLLADLARLDVAPDGQLLRREMLLEGIPLRAPDQQWRWELAPIPEWSRRYHRLHEVGAWLGSIAGARSVER